MSISKTESLGNKSGIFTGKVFQKQLTGTDETDQPGHLAKSPETKLLEKQPEDPKVWKWDAAPKYSKFTERLSDMINGASFTTDAAGALELFALQQNSVEFASQFVGTGAGFFRLTKGALEIASGIQQKRVPYLISGTLDVGIGVGTLLAGFAIAPIPTILISTALLGIRIAYDEMMGKDSIVVMGKVMKKIGKVFS